MMDKQAHCTTAMTKEKPQILQEASMCNPGIIQIPENSKRRSELNSATPALFHFDLDLILFSIFLFRARSYANAIP
jgi:hypothetical protein